MLPLIIFIAIPVLAVAFLSGRFTAKYAAQRGRSERAWFLWGGSALPALSCSVDGPGTAAKKVRLF